MEFRAYTVDGDARAEWCQEPEREGERGEGHVTETAARRAAVFDVELGGEDFPRPRTHGTATANGKHGTDPGGEME